MIGHLCGTAAEIDYEQRIVLIDVRGVGYEVCIPQWLCEDVRLGEELSLYVHADIKEDSHALYGFTSKSQRELFRVLLGVGGVGAKSAAAMLSEFSESELIRCVAEGDARGLSKVRGIGLKTAGVIVVSLKDKIATLSDSVIDAKTDMPSVLKDAIDVLVRLGIREGEAASYARQAWNQDMAAEDLIKEALRISALDR